MAAERRQLALDLALRPALGRDDFIVGAANADAVAWIDAWPEWPAGAVGLNVFGPPGAGKTHLGAVWAARSGAIDVHASSLTVDGVPDVLGAARYVLLDGVGDERDGEALLHLHNMVAERRGALLLLSRQPAARLALDPADLRSRLAALPAIGIRSPDDGLLAAVLVKLFRDRQLEVAEAVISYLVTRMDRSFEGARSIVGRIDRLALERRRPVTVALAREALDARESGDENGH